MQLYHHPLSLNSQRVRLALEEYGIDYTSYHLNPLTGKNLDPSFFRMNPTGDLPLFRNGSHAIHVDPINIIQYIERIAVVSSSQGDETCLSNEQVTRWMRRIVQWNPKYFTLAHVPSDYLNYVFKFLRRVIISRMSEAPDLASRYHVKLKEAYEMEEKLKEVEVVNRSKDQLVKLLDEVEDALEGGNVYIAGDEFTMADVMFLTVLARLELLKLEDEYINGVGRENLVRYWTIVKKRASYKKVIGRYFDGWRRRKTLLKTWMFIRARTFARRY